MFRMLRTHAPPRCACEPPIPVRSCTSVSLTICAYSHEGLCMSMCFPWHLWVPTTACFSVVQMYVALAQRRREAKNRDREPPLGLGPLRGMPRPSLPFSRSPCVSRSSPRRPKTHQEGPKTPRRGLQEPEIAHECLQHVPKIAPGYPSWDGPLGSSLILGLDRVSRWIRPGVRRT